MKNKIHIYRTGTPNDIRHFVEANQLPNRHDFLFKHLKQKKKSIKILDVGCGTGNKILALLNAGFKNTVGIEYDPDAFKLMLAKHKNLRIRQGNAEELKQFANNSFDLVYCSSVLEHIPHPDKAIKEAHRILKKRGKYKVGIPNGNHLDDLLLRAIQKIAYGKYEHLQRFTLNNFIKTLEQHSFQVQDVQIHRGSLTFLLDSRIKLRWLSSLAYNIVKHIYWQDRFIDILAVKK